MCGQGNTHFMNFHPKIEDMSYEESYRMLSNTCRQSFNGISGHTSDMLPTTWKNPMVEHVEYLDLDKIANNIQHYESNRNAIDPMYNRIDGRSQYNTQGHDVGLHDGYDAVISNQRSMTSFGMKYTFARRPVET